MKHIILLTNFTISAIYANSAFAGWGAIAYNENTNAIGSSQQQSSYDAAIFAALNQCGYGCVIKSWEHNKCNAFATGMAVSEWGSGWNYSNPTEAINKALLECGSTCTLRLWICN